MNKIRFYFFSNILNKIAINNIIKFKNICVIYRPEKDLSKNITQIQILKNFCKKNKILLYIADNYKLSSKFKADGIFLSSSNKSFVKPMQVNKNFGIIGLAHNNLEYWFKKMQCCKTIMLSPLFFNKKYSNAKILGIIKFNLMSSYWDEELCALGGINLVNLKKLKMTKASSVAFISLMKNLQIKKPTYQIGRWV